MTVHYHCTPITPKQVFYELRGKHFCVSFAYPQDIQRAHECGQSVMLDNGAFTSWRKKRSYDPLKFYKWAEPWLDYRTTWAVIPDVIDGDESANDDLLKTWPFTRHQGAPVWHLHHDISRLKRLCDEWPRVCLGSSGNFSQPGSRAWHSRMADVMDAVCVNGVPPVWLHMLRGMSLVKTPIYPFASVDSSDVARNHNIKKNAFEKANRWDGLQCPSRWVNPNPQGKLL